MPSDMLRLCLTASPFAPIFLLPGKSSDFELTNNMSGAKREPLPKDLFLDESAAFLRENSATIFLRTISSRVEIS